MPKLGKPPQAARLSKRLDVIYTFANASVCSGHANMLDVDEALSATAFGLTYTWICQNNIILL